MFKTRQASPGPQLVLSIVDFLRDWWSKDRVRASPREGRLLRVSPRSVLYIEGTRYEVAERNPVETSRGTVVRYKCNGLDDHVELWVTTGCVPSVVLVKDDAERELTVGDVEVWGRE